MVLVLGISLLVSLVASLPGEINRCASGPDHLPHPTDCTRYLTCVGSTPVEQLCPDGLEWNAREATCTGPDVAQCLSPSAQDAALSLGRIAIPAKAIGKCPPQLSRCPVAANPSEEVIFMPHGNCRKFYACDSTGPIELSCPGELYWNHNSCRCDYGRPSEASCVVGEPKEVDHTAPHIRVRREDEVVTTTTEIPLASGANIRVVSSVLMLIVTMVLNV